MIAFARDLHTVLPTMSMQNYFRPAEPARGEDEAPVKLGKRKKDPGHFWTGLLTLVSGSLGMNPVFKCMSCELDFQGTTRAAVHLHARVDPKNHVHLCPNITAGSDEQKDIKRRYDQESRPSKKKQAEKLTPQPGVKGVMKHITPVSQRNRYHTGRLYRERVWIF